MMLVTFTVKKIVKRKNIADFIKSKKTINQGQHFPTVFYFPLVLK